MNRRVTVTVACSSGRVRCPVCRAETSITDCWQCGARYVLSVRCDGRISCR